MRIQRTSVNIMKVDFNQIKTTISLPDFLLELGWKIVEGSSNACPKMSNGTHTIVIKRNSQNQYTYWDVHSDSVRGRSIMDLMQEHLFETTGKMPTLREVGEILQNYIKIIEDVNAILKKIEDKLKEKSAVPAAGTHKTEQKIIR